ncbi:MAG: hypothetical protein AAGA54_04260 [Myxococcota bacterium]
MSTTVLFVGVVVFAFVAGRFIDRFAAKLLLLSGMEYLALGIVLGPMSPMGPISQETLQALDLFVSTVLGVIGFLVGLGARRGRGGTEFTLAGLASAAGVVITVGLLTTGVLQLLDPDLLQAEPLLAEPVQVSGDLLISFWLSPDGLWGGLTIGAAAAACSASLIDVAIDRFSVSPKRTRLLRTMASSAQLLAAFAFGMAMAGHRAAEAASDLGLTLTEWSVITVVAGAATGILFSVFLGREDDPMRMLVATIGVVVFAAGVGSGLGVSPLFVNVMAGLTVAFTSPHASRLHRALDPLRFPTTVLILLLAGATWVPAKPMVWVVVPIYAVVRILLRRGFTRLAVATFVPEGSLGVGLGRGMVGQGVLAAAIAVAFSQRFPDLMPTVGTIILGGLVISDVLAMRSLRRYLADVGEIQVANQAPPPEPPAPKPTESHP